MNSIALVSANFGGIDEAKALPQHSGIDAFYYTDKSIAPAVAKTWTRIINPNYPRYDFSPRLRAKYFKLQIHRLDEVRGHRWMVWSDSSLQIRDLRFLSEYAATLALLPAHQRVLLIPHPDRATVIEEFEFVSDSIAAGHAFLTTRYAHEKMAEQIEYFRARGWNLRARLWCGGFWMMENSEPVRRALDEWWDQNLRFGMMDQLSLPVALDIHGIEPQALAIDLRRNAYFEYLAHQKQM
jgi:hypothetical protein